MNCYEKFVGREGRPQIDRGSTDTRVTYRSTRFYTLRLDNISL